MLGSSGRRPEDLIADLKNHPAIAPLVRGTEVIEYSAHLIPEGGSRMMPQLCTDGMLVAGDAAAMCLATGIWLEGVNFAIGSGVAAAKAADAAIGSGDFSESFLGCYQKTMEEDFVLADHRRFRDAPHLVMSDRVQRAYPQLICNIVESLFTVRNPDPKPGITSLIRSEIKGAGLKLRHIAKDLLDGALTFG